MAQRGDRGRLDCEERADPLRDQMQGAEDQVVVTGKDIKVGFAERPDERLDVAERGGPVAITVDEHDRRIHAVEVRGDAMGHHDLGQGARV